MRGLVMGLHEIDATRVAVAGGKGANLGELSRIEGVRVPAGFCVTTDAFRQVVGAMPSIDERLARLSGLRPDDREAIGVLCADIRRAIEGAGVPGEVTTAITRALAALGEGAACAVRSSATTEDLPTASFAGQGDSYLNLVGPGAVLQGVRRCWASLFTDRAATYRLQNGIDQRDVGMAVVVQAMVPAAAAGVMFTADPVTSDRRIVRVEAVRGLGDALVSGRANPDVHAVRDGEIVSRTIAGEEPGRRGRPALTDAEVLRLALLGRRIEGHFGRPQDVEWCLADGEPWFVQSRPITTLFPIPERDDCEKHVYLSVGHQQMMTDPMRALGLSLFQLTALPPMHEAGGRLWVDVTRALASPASRAGLLDLIGRSEPLTSDALRTILHRGDVIPSLPDEGAGGPPAGAGPDPVETDPAIVDALIAESEASIAAVAREIRTRSGPALLDFIREDIQELRRILFDPRSHRVFMAAIEASWWLNETLEEWLGETNAADVLTRSVPRNVTSEMGLALMDVADAIRPHPEVVAFLERAPHEGLLDGLETLAGGREARDALTAFLDRYGMRGPGEIDITRPRWSERPALLVPLILGNVRNVAPGAGARRFEEGRREALGRRREILERVRGLPDGEQKAGEVARMIDRVRAFIGYREYPKYGMVSRYLVYKRALMEEARRLVGAGVLREAEDAFHLTFQELADVARTARADHDLIARRRAEYRANHALTPPRVLTSDGEVVAGAYRRADLPPGALAGVAVTAGTVEGRARVVLDMADADLEAGDILVTVFTDPGWTPLFVSIAGLVTEVGGQMTHGAVIAREYGLPAVVGVEGATRLIRDGQRIRVHGTDGVVEILPSPGPAPPP